MNLKLKFKFEDFEKLDVGMCNLIDSKVIFFALLQETNGNPCETGCAWFDMGRCQGYVRLKQSHTPDSRPRTRPTNAQIAKERGISKRQVSKLRKSGEIEQ